jgi:hypothetical protein
MLDSVFYSPTKIIIFWNDSSLAPQLYRNIPFFIDTQKLRYQNQWISK